MTKNPHAAALGRLRAKRLGKERTVQIATIAANARWAQRERESDAILQKRKAAVGKALHKAKKAKKLASQVVKQ